MNNDNELKRLIAEYFDGNTTLAEENRLRVLLSQSDDRSTEAEEARAVLSLFAASRKLEAANRDYSPKPSAAKPQRKYRYFMRLSVAAAIVTVLFAAATALLLPSADLQEGTGRDLLAGMSSSSKSLTSNRPSACFARIGGETTNDPDAVESIVLSQLGEIGAASGNLTQTVDNDISIISEFIKQQNNI